MFVEAEPLKLSNPFVQHGSHVGSRCIEDRSIEVDLSIVDHRYRVVDVAALNHQFVTALVDHLSRQDFALQMAAYQP